MNAPAAAAHKPAAANVVAWVLPFVIAAIAFTIGIDWGLPSRATDRYLFGDRTPWTGAQIMALTGGWTDTPDRAADRDLNPLADRDQLLIVNATDAQRAEIVQRFRLYSHQPDEMLTLRAIAQMRPGLLQLDPKMYQYGGLWFYPIAGLLKAGEQLGVLTLRGDVAYYLDHPEEFARFYIVMRAYSALWGLAGVAAVMLIVRRMTGSPLATCLGGVSFAFLPVVMNMAHEAKPHLAGATLLLWTILAAAAYVERGGAARAALAGLTWGAATGMVLLSLPGGIILLAMVLLRRQPWRTRGHDLLIAGATGVLLYCVTNPYVPLHALRGTGPLATNVDHYGTFYRVSDLLAGLRVGADLIAEGATPVVAMLGAVAALIAVGRLAASRTRDVVRSPVTTLAILIAVPASLVALQFVLLGAGKPGEYGRFGILPAVALLIASITAAADGGFTGGKQPWLRPVLLGVVMLACLINGGQYLRNFAVDRAGGTRHAATATLATLADLGASTRLGVVAEPAPYCMPPVDLFRWQLMLLPKTASSFDPADVDAVVATVDRLQPRPPVGFSRVWYPGIDVAGLHRPTRISWANKPVELLVASRNSHD